MKLQSKIIYWKKIQNIKHCSKHLPSSPEYPGGINGGVHKFVRSYGRGIIMGAKINAWIITSDIVKNLEYL